MVSKIKPTALDKAFGLGDGKELTSVGVNVHVPNTVWIGLGAAVTVPVIFIILLIIVKQKL